MDVLGFGKGLCRGSRYEGFYILNLYAMTLKNKRQYF